MWYQESTKNTKKNLELKQLLTYRSLLKLATTLLNLTNFKQSQIYQRLISVITSDRISYPS